MAPRPGGIKQKKLIIHLSTSLLFLLFYSPKPRSQVRIFNISEMVYYKGVIKRLAPYILRLLAGKFETICKAFPLKTFLTKISRGHPLEFFPPKNLNIYHLTQKNWFLSFEFFKKKNWNPVNHCLCSKWYILWWYLVR